MKARHMKVPNRAIPRTMKHTGILLALAGLLLASCAGDKKATAYEGLYKEQPFTILVAPVQDNTKRQQEKNAQDRALNEDLDLAATFVQQACVNPLVSQGYYAIPPLAGNTLVEQYGKGYRQLLHDDIAELNRRYGVDAVLLVALHKWAEPEVNEVVVYAEYTLRSVLTGSELMHTWVRGDKIQPVDDKGEPIGLAADNAFVQATDLPAPLAYRCRLLQAMSDFVLRNMPTSASRWMFRRDQYTAANPNFYRFVMNPDGSIARDKYDADAYGNECFTD